MKRIILCLCLFIFIRSEAQQINPVPDYVFSNKMSVGRNAVTDTAAYFSIGPRYGAVRGFMPPMVTDTATITTGKRNGLTIFSIQKNKYMYWDSVRVQWSDFAGSSGAYIFATDTASMLSPYLRAAGYALSKSGQTISADTSLLATRAWRKKGDDSLGAVIATKVNISDTSSMLGNYIRHAGNGLTKTGQALSVDTAAIATRARVQKAVDSLGAVKGSGTVTSVSAGTGMSFTTITTTGSVAADTTVLSTRAWRRKGLDSLAALELSISDTASMLTPYTRGSGTTNYLPKFTGSRTFVNSLIFDNGTQVGVNTNGPAYALDVNGTFRSVNGSNFATTSGQVAIGTATTAGKVRIAGDAFDVNTQTSYALVIGNPNTDYSIGADASYVYHQSWNSKAILLNNLGNNTIINPSSGSVSIGNTSPSYKLDITGTLRSTGNTFLGTSSSEVYVNTTTDAGAYALQVAGAIYNTTGAVFAASSGNVSIGSGVAAPDKLYVKNDAASYTTISIDNQNSAGAGTGTQFALYDGGTLTSYFRRNRDGSATTDIGVSDALRFFTQTTTTPVQRMQLNAAGELLLGYTADQGTYIIQANGNALIAGNIRTAAPAGGTANDWRLGTVATVTPTSPNRTIEVSIGGTIYYIHAKTTND